MDIIFTDLKFKELCQNKGKLIKKYGLKNSRKIIQRIDQLRAIESVGLMLQYKIGRCHPLKGDFKGLFALDLEHPKRLLIEPIFEEKADISKADYYKVKKVKILGVGDYHG